MKDNLLLTSSSFEFKTYCLYCCQAIAEREFRDRKASQVMSKNREFDKKVLEVCDKRNDAVKSDSTSKFSVMYMYVFSLQRFRYNYKIFLKIFTKTSVVKIKLI